MREGQKVRRNKNLAAGGGGGGGLSLERPPRLCPLDTQLGHGTVKECLE